MVSECAEKNTMGKTFGIHKMLDMAGSAAGILLAYALFMNLGSDSYKTVFIVSVIPLLLALTMFLFIKEKKEHRPVPQRENFWRNIGQLDNRLKLYLVVAFLFTLGNSSNIFLLLRAGNVGFSGTDVILLYFIYNITASILAIPFGKWSDKIGRKRILVIGYAVFAVVYLLFAFATSKAGIVGAFFIYGFYTAMISGAEKAFIAEIAPSHLKGTTLGLHATLVGIALLPASVIAGLLWDGIGSYAPFAFGAILAITAAITLQFGLRYDAASKK